ncbi:hypothetical protein A6U86_21075 [Rhizobium sp. AC27/96]|uniref:hypothetical protein n=1 Tax=Rhizobium sp. AC27/96 TaxID=1841653 RepID=UPI000827433A|nr:hypothetical protein [Rhizobium sp. AC27/96]OCI92003.1 hypothetical protein A6U86_21075 [Rhizobium sp. AC27/96]
MAYLPHPAHATVRGKRRLQNRVLLTILCIILSSWPTLLSAHGGSSGSQAGIPIPSLTHGEMAVMAPYYGRIIAIAEDVSDTDETFRRLLNFAQIQRAYCLWGMMPGSVSDEESPFNECSHAYLAAAKAVLLKMRTMKGDAVSVADLASEIDTALVRNNLSLVLCQFSSENFNTADLIRPKPADIVRHAQSLLAILSVLLAIGAGLWLTARALRTEPIKKHRR